MIVLDASAAVELLLGTEGFDAVADRLENTDGSTHAPHLIDVEVLHSLRRLVLTKQLSAAEADESLDIFQSLDIVRYPHGPLLERAWEMRSKHSGYDAVYLALAEALAADLLTADARLIDARLHSGRVVLVR